MSVNKVNPDGSLTRVAGIMPVDQTYNPLSERPQSGIAVAQAIPTKVSDLSNDSGFITNTVANLTNYYLKSETYTQAEVNSLIAAITTLNIEVVNALPVSDISTTTIYLVPKATAGTQDVYDEWINIDGTSSGWEHIGSTEIDLTNYYTKSEVNTLLSSKANSADLATVATSGSYNDLSDKPTITAGHTVKDAEGTALTQRANLQIGGMLKTSDDSTNGATVISDLAEEVDWSVWNAMTDVEREAYSEGKKIDLINVPNIDGKVSVDMLTKLWENPNTYTSSEDTFEPQDIELSSEDYDFLLWDVRYNNLNPQTRVYISKKQTSVLLNEMVTFTTSNDPAYFQRTIGWRTDSTTGKTIYHVNDALSQTPGAGARPVVNNKNIIPMAIYGIKKSISFDVSVLVSDVSTSAEKCMLSDGETSVEDALNYSTSEHVVGEWIDGSTLYEKIIDFGALPNNTSKSVAHGISNISEVTECITMCERDDGNVFRPFESFAAVKYYITKSDVIVITTDNLSSYDKSHVTLRYTKTS